MKDQQPNLNKSIKDVLTDTPEQEEITIRSDINPKAPRSTTPYYGGDSVDQYNELKEANESFVADKELGQQNENN
ncbi:hypothetical protein [Bacillus sp. FJAT-45350]|uniref:hypothetical protein n=1 Tax=Bacillus sp. FJAT-45350 TaxID=2011014 RepID=UPI000BB81078|nr:hypothetical protein [Bacillus sp. FJAT-45350]